MSQNSLKSCLLLSSAIVMLSLISPYASATDTDFDERRVLSQSQPYVWNLDSDKVTIESPAGWIFGSTTFQIPKAEYDDKKIFTQKYPNHRLVVKPLVVESPSEPEKEKTVKIEYNGWTGSYTLEIPLSEYDNKELFDQKYFGYHLMEAKEEIIETSQEPDNLPVKHLVEAKEEFKETSQELDNSTAKHLVEAKEEVNETSQEPDNSIGTQTDAAKNSIIQMPTLPTNIETKTQQMSHEVVMLKRPRYHLVEIIEEEVKEEFKETSQEPDNSTVTQTVTFENSIISVSPLPTNVETETPQIFQEVVTPKPTIKSADLKEIVSSLKDDQDLTMSSLVSVIEEHKKKSEIKVENKEIEYKQKKLTPKEKRNNKKKREA